MTKLECKKCGKIHSIESSELNFECVETDSGRQMGPENTYSGEVEFNCDKCENNINAKFTFWEYPAMALNNSESEAEGCKIIEEPDYQAFLTESDSGDE